MPRHMVAHARFISVSLRKAGQRDRPLRLTASSGDGKPERLKGFHDYEQRFGDELRGMRASKSKSLLDVQRELGIRPYMIVAIENGDPESFDSPWMISGVVKSYARYLGMDPDDAVARFQEDCRSRNSGGRRSAKTRRIAVPGRQRRSGDDGFESSRQRLMRPYARVGIPSGTSGPSPTAIFSTAIVAALVGGGLFLGWTLYKDVQTLPVVATSQQYGGFDYASKPTTTVTAPLAPTEPRLPPEAFAALMPISELDHEEIGVYAPGRSAVAAAELPLEADGQFEQSDLMDLAAASPQAGPVPEVDSSALVIVVSREVWIRVNDSDGTVLKEGLLAPGEEYEVPEGGTNALRAGLAGSVYFRIDGEVYGPAGSGGNVIKDFALSSVAIVENFDIVEFETAPEEVRRYVFVVSEGGPPYDLDN